MSAAKIAYFRVPYRTDGAQPPAEHDGMKTIREKFPALYAKWTKASWPLLTGRPGPSSEIPKPKPAQVAAEQEWEDEGGCVKPAKAVTAPAPKIPL